MLEHLERARPKILPGGQRELDYVIFKTRSYILHLETLCAMLDGCIAYDSLIEAKLKGDKGEMQQRLDRCRKSYLAARDLGRKTAEPDGCQSGRPGREVHPLPLQLRLCDPDRKCLPDHGRMVRPRSPLKSHRA